MQLQSCHSLGGRIDAANCTRDAERSIEVELPKTAK
jgi:hypothetical protein